MTIEVLNPTYDQVATEFEPTARLAELAGCTIGIVSNGKQGTGRFFEALEHELKTRHGVAHVDMVVKPNYSAPVPTEMLGRAQQWNALISGIGD